MNKKDIRWVIALKAEAKPIIKFLGLKIINNNLVYPIYKDDLNTNWLVVSGAGQNNAGDAAKYLNELSGSKRWSVWINIGIAGSALKSYGQLFMIDKITSRYRRQCFYPGTVVKTKLKKAELLTVDEPLSDYSDVDLVDMEAAKFFEVTSKISNRDLILVMKIVSDGPSNPINKLNAAVVSELISANLIDIIEQADKMLDLASIEEKRLKHPLGYDDIIQRWHFTVSQTHEIKLLIRRWNVTQPFTNLIDEIIELKNSREVIMYLKNNLNNYEIDWK